MNAFVDTNIFIRVATQGRPGCEHEHFDDLLTLVKSGTLTLLVPEVVHLEVQKAFGSLAKELESNCDKLGNSVTKTFQHKDLDWNEIDSLKEDVLNYIQQLKRDRIAKCKELWKEIAEFLDSDAVTKIPLTPEILVSAKRRQISGKMPNGKRSDQDALIVESLISYFHNNGSDSSLLFCTENTTDFGLEVATKELDRSYILHPDIQEAFLPEAHFSRTLSSMLSVTAGFEHFYEPTDAEINAALTNHDIHNIDDEIFNQHLQALMEVDENEYIRQFNEDMLPSLPDDIKNLRIRLADEITQLLLKCRNCRSWGERSEYKLPQWIEYIDESMIPYTSLPKMIRIRDSLKEYLQIHLRMDSELSSEENRN